MVDLLHFLSNFLLLILPIVLPLTLFIFRNPSSGIPTSYPVLGSLFAIRKNKERRVQWISDMIISSPTLTFTLRRPFGYHQIFTANAANVRHILKTHFYNYPKGDFFRATLRDFLGDGIFNADGHNWKLQRHLSSHHFSTKSLRRFVQTVVDAELSQRLVPTLQVSAAAGTAVDLQDILQRFAFDNICRIAFGYDPAYLLPSMPVANFAAVFDSALALISERFNSNIPMVWKVKRALGVGKERQLREKVEEVREFAKRIMREKKAEMERNPSLEAADDLLSRFLSSGHSDEEFVADVVICFILAGRDTSSAALTWFFWLLSNHPEVEKEVVKEISRGSSSEDGYEEAKSMVYTHAALCEAMRLYPPVPVSTKSAAEDDVLPDGTVIRKGTRISYHPYAMGRVQEVWGRDWAKFEPQRWLEREEKAAEWRFVGSDPYSYPVFQAGPRICLGKDMAFLQMKRVAAGILRQFRVVPAEESMVPVYASDFTSKMKGGFMVRILGRASST